MDSTLKRTDLGYYGNIWIRQNLLENKGESTIGHKHKFDHVSLLSSGAVKVEIEGFEPKELTAPTFIVIRKEYNHKFTALTNDVTWYCIFALRDFEGQVIDDLFDPEKHDPMSYRRVDDDYWKNAVLLEKMSTQIVE